MSDVSIVASLLGFAPGAVGGVCSVFVGHPIDLIKVRQQCGPSPGTGSLSSAAATADMTVMGMLRGVFVKEGVAGLYRGITAPLVAVTPAFAVNFWSYDFATRRIRDMTGQEKHAKLTIAQTSLAGAFSGIPLALIIGPSERIKCLMQVDKTKYSGFGDCARQVYREGGLRSVFRGTGSAMLRDVPGNAAYFATYEYLKRKSCEIEGREEASVLGTLLAGGFAGVNNWIVAIPFDTIKSRWQTAPAGMYNSLWHVFQSLIQKEGTSALFRGLSPALMRAFPANAACLCGVETVKKMIEER